ncbi:MAG: hypothetical protein ACE5Q6_04800 [Dehalococcoidia bacterium]
MEPSSDKTVVDQYCRVHGLQRPTPWAKPRTSVAMTSSGGLPRLPKNW